MAIPAAVRSDLRSLSDGIDGPDNDLVSLLQSLIETMRDSIESYSGLTVTIMGGSGPYTFTVMDDPVETEVATSAWFPLAAFASVAPGSVMILYASTPGAFVDLAADFVFLAGIDLVDVVFDEHLIPPTQLSARRSLARMARANQAIGVLIGQGHGVDEAVAELQRLADDAKVSVQTAAERVIQNAIDTAETG